MRMIIRVFLLAIVLAIVLFPIYVFASSNTGLKASGEGASTISGWIVSNVKYQLADDPSLIKSISLDLNGNADQVSVKLNTRSVMYTSCTKIYERHWQCDFFGGIRLADVDELRLVAVGN